MRRVSRSRAEVVEEGRPSVMKETVLLILQEAYGIVMTTRTEGGSLIAYGLGSLDLTEVDRRLRPLIHLGWKELRHNLQSGGQIFQVYIWLPRLSTLTSLMSQIQETWLKNLRVC